MPIESSLLIFKYGFSFGSNVINSIQIQSLISEIYQNMSLIYSDIQKSKLDAARICIEQAKLVLSETERREEINNAIQFLEGAYSFATISLNRKITRYYTYLLFFTRTEEIEIVPWNKKEEWISYMTDISSTIYLLYKYKNSTLANKWYDETIKLYRNVINNYFYISPYDLKEINENYARIYEETELVRIEYNEFFTKYEKEVNIKTEITPEGKQYILSQKKEKIEDFKKKLKLSEIEFK